MNIQDFLFRHVEKFIFGVLVLLGVFLIYRGIQMPDYLKEQQPERMEEGANQVKRSIDEDHWQSINTAESRLPTIDVVARTNESIRPVVPNLYRLNHPWEGKSVDLSIKRNDPELVAPTEVLVRGVIASMAVKTQSAEYPLTQLENAEPVEKVAEPKRAPPRRRSRVSMEEMMGGAGERGSEDAMAEMYGGGGMPGMGAGGAAGGTLTPARRIDNKYDLGFRPTTSTAVNLEPVMAHFIAGVALVPHKKLHSAFEAALQQADGWNPLRDQPVYIGFQLQRADVTDKTVDQLTDQDWVNRGSSRDFQTMLLTKWAGMAKEIVAGKYRDPELTTPIPPILLTHYSSFMSHPKIPLGDEDLRGTTQQFGPAETIPTGPILPSADDDPFGNVGGADMTRRGIAPMMGGAPGMGGAPMMGGAPGMGGAPMMGGAPGMGGAPMMGGAPGMGGAPMMGGGMMGGGMMGGGSMGIRSIVDQPDHKLIRFYDFRDTSGMDKAAPQPGRKYVYRVRIAIEDPNFPRSPAMQPRNSTLSAEVFRRVEQETAKASKTNRRNSIRWSEFSEPSAAVSLPSSSTAFAGPVVPGVVRRLQADGREIEFTQKPPVGKVAATQWDSVYNVPVPMVMDVIRGSVLAQKGPADVPDPLAMIVKKLPDADINTKMVLLDLGGGQPLAISPAEDQTEPGLMLLINADGNLQVSDEIDAQHNYRFYSFADERGL
jgi:hypothetical protein